jgi:predicted O-methyltransferase YrrM
MTDNLPLVLHERFNPKSSQSIPVRIKGFTRRNLAEYLNEIRLFNGVEVGTAQGLYALQLCQSIYGIKLTCVDPYMKYHWKNSTDEHERCFKLAHERLDPYGVTILRKTSMEAVGEFKDKSLDFIYIDGNHEFDYVMEDLISLGRKVKSNGIIALHDYYRFSRAGVVEAVDVYTKAHQINEFFICDYLVKVDKEPEYTVFWAKP